jgi:hypothetical protein
VHWLDFTASVIHSLAWPAALVVLGLFFRSQIQGLARRLESFSARGATALFAREVEAVSVRVAEEELTAIALEAGGTEAPDLDLGGTETPEISVEGLEEAVEKQRLKDEEERKRRVAEVKAWRPPAVAVSLATALPDFPQAAVLVSWQVLEDGLIALAKEHGLVLRGTSFTHAVDMLDLAGAMDRSDVETLDKLEQLRSRVLEAKGLQVSTAIGYARSVDKFVNTVSRQLEEPGRRARSVSGPLGARARRVKRSLRERSDPERDRAAPPTDP